MLQPTTQRRSKRNKVDDDDENYNDDNDNSEEEEEEEGLDDDDVVTTNERRTINGKQNSLASTPTSAIQEMYTYIAALQLLVDAIDNVQDKKVKDLVLQPQRWLCKLFEQGGFN